MQAALLIRPTEIVVDDVPEPTPGPGEVRVAIGGVGLCGSDLSMFRGIWTAPSYPWIQGHEAFGRIQAVGAGVDPARLGQSVVIEPNTPCFRCDQCSLGRTSACRDRRSMGMNRPGALAEMVVVPSWNAWPLDGPATDLVCVEPLTVVETALRRLGGPLPEAALVVGVGSQGLLACVSLIRRDVHVYAFDVRPERVAFAGTLGVRELPNEGPPEPIGLVFDTAGSPGSMEVAIAHAAIGGTIIALGLDSRPVELAIQTLVRRQLTIRGSLTYDHPADFAASVRRVRDRAIAPGQVITDEYPLEEAQRAFESSGSARGKTWIRVAPSA